VPDDEKRRAQEAGEDAHAILFLKRFTVFNLAQCDGLPADLATAAPPPEPSSIEPRVEALIKATGIDFPYWRQPRFLHARGGLLQEKRLPELQRAALQQELIRLNAVLRGRSAQMAGRAATSER